MSLRSLFGRHDPSPAERAFAASAIPPADTPWREARFVVVDLETTGLDPRRDEIISFAAIPIDHGRIRSGAALTLVVRPRRMPPAETIRIHGLRAVDLENASPVGDRLDAILESLTDRVLVAHAAWVERGFLNAALKGRRLALAEPVLDTVHLAWLALSRDGAEVESLNLGALARAFNLPVHRPHHADGDALTTAQLFLAAVSRLDADEPQTVGSLARLSER